LRRCNVATLQRVAALRRCDAATLQGALKRHAYDAFAYVQAKRTIEPALLRRDMCVYVEFDEQRFYPGVISDVSSAANDAYYSRTMCPHSFRKHWPLLPSHAPVSTNHAYSGEAHALVPGLFGRRPPRARARASECVCARAACSFTQLLVNKINKGIIRLIRGEYSEH
jgi:hypothetical protein